MRTVILLSLTPSGVGGRNDRPGRWTLFSDLCSGSGCRTLACAPKPSQGGAHSRQPQEQQSTQTMVEVPEVLYGVPSRNPARGPSDSIVPPVGTWPPLLGELIIAVPFSTTGPSRLGSVIFELCSMLDLASLVEVMNQRLLLESGVLAWERSLKSFLSAEEAGSVAISIPRSARISLLCSARGSAHHWRPHHPPRGPSASRGERLVFRTTKIVDHGGWKGPRSRRMLLPSA
jgi:hypothetical protein